MKFLKRVRILLPISRKFECIQIHQYQFKENILNWISYDHWLLLLMIPNFMPFWIWFTGSIDFLHPLVNFSRFSILCSHLEKDKSFMNKTQFLEWYQIFKPPCLPRRNTYETRSIGLIKFEISILFTFIDYFLNLIMYTILSHSVPSKCVVMFKREGWIILRKRINVYPWINVYSGLWLSFDAKSVV